MSQKVTRLARTSMPSASRPCSPTLGGSALPLRPLRSFSPAPGVPAQARTGPSRSRGSAEGLRDTPSRLLHVVPPPPARNGASAESGSTPWAVRGRVPCPRSWPPPGGGGGRRRGRGGGGDLAGQRVHGDGERRLAFGPFGRRGV